MTALRDSTRAVSEVVGEMLMIGLVLILVAVFTSTLPGYLPSERSPVVSIVLHYDHGGNITLWHKGGDWVKTQNLRVIVSNDTSHVIYTGKSSTPFRVVPDTQAFDLGSNLTLVRGIAFTGDEQIALATDRAVIFSGSVRRV